MAFQNKDLSVLAYANGFTSWHYITADAPTEVIAPGYFNGAADLMRVGDLLAINAGGAAPANFMLSVTSNIRGAVVASPLWSPTAAKSESGTMSRADTEDSNDALTETAKRIAWELRARLSICYSHNDDVESLWADLITPDRDACLAAARASKAEA